MITAPTYCTREDVAAAADVRASAYMSARLDRLVDSGSRSIEGLTHRQFYPQTATRYWDWPPDGGYGRPWRLWLDGNDLADTTITVVSGGVTIDGADVLCEPQRYGPPYDHIELDRSSDAAFGGGDTPQRDIAITGTFGYWTATSPAGALAASVDGTATTITVTNAAAVGVGDLLAAGTERLLVTGRAMTSTGQTQQGAGAGTASAADVSLAVTNGAAFTAGETLLLDSERMLVVDIAGNTLTVKRAYDGSVLATHTGATIYAPRALTVTRGATGTTGTAHTSGTVLARHVAPALVGQLAVAEAVVALTNEGGAYARSRGSGDSKVSAIGAGIDDLRARVYATYGRKARHRAV